MKPACSTVLFSVASEAGLGLMALLALARLFHAAPPSANWWFAWVVAALLIGAGLAASIIRRVAAKNFARADPHPGGVWRSRQFRFAVLLYPASAAYAWAAAAPVRGLELVLGAGVIALCLTILYCAAMITACRQDVPRWHTWHTKLTFPLLGLMSGALLLTALMPPAAAPVAARIAVALILLAAALKLAYFVRFAEAPASTAGRTPPQSGQGEPTGQGGQAVRDSQVPRGDPGGAEYALSRNSASLLKLVVFFFGFVAPFVLIGLSPKLAGIASGSALIGLLAERWLFIAEARPLAPVGPVRADP